jgi:hypothetical protein
VLFPVFILIPVSLFNHILFYLLSLFIYKLVNIHLYILCFLVLIILVPVIIRVPSSIIFEQFLVIFPDFFWCSCVSLVPNLALVLVIYFVLVKVLDFQFFYRAFNLVFQKFNIFSKIPDQFLFSVSLLFIIFLVIFLVLIPFPDLVLLPVFFLFLFQFLFLILFWYLFQIFFILF